LEELYAALRRFARLLWRLVLAVVVLLTLIGISTLLPLGGESGPRLGLSLPDLSLTTLEGEPYSLKELAGRPMLVWFTGAKCETCLDTAEALTAASREFDGLTIIVVDIWVTPNRDRLKLREPGAPSLDTPEDLEWLRGQVGPAGFDWLWALDDGSWATAFNIGEPDIVVFVDREGLVAASWRGPLEVEPFIEELKGLMVP
jgi:thiol-disulfide isomerase/thioredoxin